MPRGSGVEAERPMRFRRHVAAPRTPSRGQRRLAREAALVAALAFAGFALAAVWLSPVPLIPRRAMVPRVLDLEADSARRALAALGYRAVLASAEEDDVVPAGRILWQDPPPGLALPAGGTVTLTASAGRPEYPVPDLNGLDARQAGVILEAAGFRLGAIDTAIDRQRELGIVLGTRPSAGAARQAGTQVDLIVNGASR